MRPGGHRERFACAVKQSITIRTAGVWRGVAMPMSHWEREKVGEAAVAVRVSIAHASQSGFERSRAC